MVLRCIVPLTILAYIGYRFVDFTYSFWDTSPLENTTIEPWARWALVALVAAMAVVQLVLTRPGRRRSRFATSDVRSMSRSVTLMAAMLLTAAGSVTTHYSGFYLGRPLRGRRCGRGERECDLGEPLLPAVVGVGPECSGPLVAAWVCAARMEHASVPAFAQLSMQLLALGAPFELVEGAHRAALEEVEHARDAFAIASRFAGRELSAGPMPVVGRVDATSGDVVALAVASWRDGCLGEGVAARVAADAAEHAGDVVVAEALWKVAREEQSHAELAWGVVEWALRTEPVLVGRAIRKELSRMPGLDSGAPHEPGVAGLAPSRPEMLASLYAAVAHDATERVLNLLHQVSIVR